jgi:hypothetical protein
MGKTQPAGQAVCAITTISKRRSDKKDGLKWEKTPASGRF